VNIFALDECSKEAAQQMIDKHVTKMPTETCQMLHTNLLYMMFVSEYDNEPSLKELKQYHKLLDSNLMKPAMLNHPSTIWARESLDNFNWLLSHGKALCEEFDFRYNKRHGSYDRILDVDNHGKLLRNHDFKFKELTPVRIAMDSVYRIENTFDDEWEYVIQSYRHYYLEGKWRFASWKNDRRPYWFPANHFAKKYNVGVRLHNASNPKYPMVELEEDL